MRKLILCGVVLLFTVACASAPVTQEDIEKARPEARTIIQEFGLACVSLGMPEGSRRYIQCALDFYQKENVDAMDRRSVLTKAIRWETRGAPSKK